MIRYVLLTCVLALVTGTLVAAQTPRPGATPDPLEYSDAAMHFRAPDGYVSLGQQRVDINEISQPTAVAAWAKFPGKENQRTITLTIEPYAGSLAGYETTVENELRGQIDGLLVSNKGLTGTPNGMPAYWMELTYGEGFAGQKRFQYVWFDGLRGVIAAVTGRTGELQESEARQALSGIYAVLYPLR